MSSLMLRRPFASAVVDNHTSPAPAAKHTPAFRILFITNLTRHRSNPTQDPKLAGADPVAEGCPQLWRANVAQTTHVLLQRFIIEKQSLITLAGKQSLWLSSNGQEQVVRVPIGNNGQLSGLLMKGDAEISLWCEAATAQRVSHQCDGLASKSTFGVAALK